MAYYWENIKNNNWKQTYHNTINLRGQFANFKTILGNSFKTIMSSAVPEYFRIDSFRNYHKEFSYINSGFWDNNKSELKSLTNKFVPNLNDILHRQFTGAEMKVLLRTGDRNSMRFSVESRVPFADDLPLIEYLFSVPSSYKIRQNYSKYLLRTAMKDVLPEAIYARKDKLGFATPEKHWLHHNKDFFKKYITTDLEQFFDVKLILKEWDSQLTNIPSHATNRMYRIIQFAAWKKIFNL